MAEQTENKKIKQQAFPVKGTARLSYLRMTPRKARAITGLLKGLSVNEAEAQLIMQRRRAAKPILKLIRSAVAGAVKNHRSNPDKLFIENIRVDQGPMLKRILPRARGIATPIQKKMSHVTLVIAENQGLGEGRFRIEKLKKAKKAVKEKQGKEKKQQMKEKPSEQYVQRSEPGFFKRIFRRKSV